MSGSRAKIASTPATSAFACNTMFETLEEAQATGMFSFIDLVMHLQFLLSNSCPFAFTTVDDVYILDFENPEANGHGIFAFKVPDIKSADGRFLFDKVKIILTNGVTDLADIPKIAGVIVLGGQAFHLALPSVPEHLREQHDALFLLDDDRCAKTEEQFALHINRISNDPGRSMHTILFVLPDGHAFANDFVTPNASPSIMDQVTRVVVRECPVTKTIDPGGAVLSQVFYPGFFEMRVLSCNAASKELKSKSKKVESFSTFFTGMKKVTQGPTPMETTSRAPKKNGVQGEQGDA